MTGNTNPEILKSSCKDKPAVPKVNSALGTSQNNQYLQ